MNPLGVVAGILAGLGHLRLAAARDRRSCAIVYHGSGAEDVGARVIHPYCLVHAGGEWYVVGWCAVKEGMRVFRLDRILEAAETDDRLGFVSPLTPCRTEGMMGQQPTEEPGIHEIFAVPYGCCLIRREVFTDVGLLDPTFRHYASDTDHQYRANAFGWKSAWCSHIYVDREQHPPREPWWSRDRALYARRWGRV